MSSRRRWALLVAAVLPGTLIYSLVQVFMIEALWLFAWLTGLFTAASLLLTWLLVDWQGPPPPQRPTSSLRRR